MSKAYVYAAEQIDLHCPYAFIANNYTTQEQRENDMFNKMFEKTMQVNDSD